MSSLYLTVGLPGSGKSTYIHNRVANYGGIHISRDEIRFSLLKPNEDYFSRENQVFEIFIEKIQKAINDGIESIYIDATHLTEKARNKVLNRLDLSKIEDIRILMFDVPLKTCLERNAKRSGLALVPEEAIRRMRYSIVAPGFWEKYTYSAIMEINEDGLMVNRWVRGSREDIENYCKYREKVYANE